MDNYKSRLIRIINQLERKPTMDDILAAVSRETVLSIPEITGVTRNSDVSDARSIAAYLMRIMIGAPRKNIAAKLGYTVRSGMVCAIDRAGTLLATDSKFVDLMDRVVARLVCARTPLPHAMTSHAALITEAEDAIAGKRVMAVWAFNGGVRRLVEANKALVEKLWKAEVRARSVWAEGGELFSDCGLCGQRGDTHDDGCPFAALNEEASDD